MEKAVRYVGFEVHALNKLIGRRASAITVKHCGDDMPVMGSWVLAYIEERPNQPVYQKDIEKEFCMAPSSVTKVIKQMEKSGYIRRCSVESDARLKKLEITDKAKAFQKDIMDDMHKNIDEKLLTGISEQERETFFRIIDQMKSNL